MRRLLPALLIVLAVAVPRPALAIDPPYEAQMERLAEILGSLYFLNPLCKPGGTDWRQELADLVQDAGFRHSVRAFFHDAFGGARSFHTTTPPMLERIEKLRTAQLEAIAAQRSGPSSSKNSDSVAAS